MKKLFISVALTLVCLFLLVSCQSESPGFGQNIGDKPGDESKPGDDDSAEVEYDCSLGKHKFGEPQLYAGSENLSCEKRMWFKVCEDCAEIKWIQGTEADHAWTAKFIAATCKSDGSIYKVCSACGKNEVISIIPVDRENHNWVVTQTIEPTCLDEGYNLYTCALCGASKASDYTSTVEHSTTLQINNYYHWQECKWCHDTFDMEEHRRSGNNCIVCGKYVSEYDIYWKETPINYQLSEASDAGMFTSGVRRYYAGSDPYYTALIDVSIRNRNRQAEAEANVKINYSYLEDISSNDWSRSVETIAKNTNSYTAGKSIDVYCNFVYDLACASVKGCFASLKANTAVSEAKYGTGKNFFAFNEEGYEWNGESCFDSGAGQGYFYEYMLSLTLSDNKVYLLGSDYCTDLVRAFHVVPVNIDLMNNIKADIMPAFEDIAFESGMTNIEYFYKGVWDGQWTYNTLLKFSTAVYQPSTTGDPNADITDVLGFAISGGNLPASGILYSSSVQIVNKEAMNATKKAELLAADSNNAKYMTDGYYITYPETNSKLVEFTDALNDLFTSGASKGICFVDDTGAANSIRSSFVAGNILFGSIISLGSLEDADYQSLRAGNGFGIVPVPVYKAGETYQTFVHNNARIVAIARLTDRYEQISAYLDYQSRNSSDILEIYYNETLAQSLEGEVGNDNAEMLKYIRNHVRNVFDKTYEDVMGDFNKKTDPQADLRRWHEILRINKFQISNMATVYEENKATKEADLVNVINAWNKLI